VTTSAIKMARIPVRTRLGEYPWSHFHSNPLEIPKLNKIAAHQSILRSSLSCHPPLQMLGGSVGSRRLGFFIETMQDIGRTALRSQILVEFEEILRILKSILDSYFQRLLHSCWFISLTTCLMYSSALWAKLEMPSRCWNINNKLE